MIDAHRGAFEYDWRTRFHVPLDVVGRSMSWGEAYRLVERLCSDPASHVAASIAGWDHLITRVDMTLRDLYDLQHTSKSKKQPKPYPRPWSSTKRRTKPDERLTQDEIIAALRLAGHTAPIPKK